MLWEFMINCDNLKNVVVSTPRDNYLERDNTVGYRSPKDLGFPGISFYIQFHDFNLDIPCQV